MLSQELEEPPAWAAGGVAVLTLLLEDRFILTGGGVIPLLLAGSTPSIR